MRGAVRNGAAGSCVDRREACEQFTRLCYCQVVCTDVLDVSPRGARTIPNTPSMLPVFDAAGAVPYLLFSELRYAAKIASECSGGAVLPARSWECTWGKIVRAHFGGILLV